MPGATPSSVGVEVCGALRRAAERGLSSVQAVEDLDLEVDPSTARKHARGVCTCETTVPPTSFPTDWRLSSEECTALRRLAQAGWTAAGSVEALRLDVEPCVARYHATGRCPCSTDVSPDSSGDPRRVIGPDACRVLRQLADEGLSCRTAIDEMGLDVSQPAARRHANGECSCEPDVPPTPFRSFDTVGPGECAGLRRLADEGLTAHAAVDELGMNVGGTTAYRHAAGRCTCDPDVPPTPFDNAGTKIDGECGELRRLTAQGYSASDAIDELGLDVWKATVYEHVRGKCTCDTDVPPQQYESTHSDKRSRKVSREECSAIRRQLRAGSTPSEVDTPFTRKTVKRHGTGNCTHDRDESPIDPTTETSSVSAEMCRLAAEMYHESHHHIGRIKEEIEARYDEYIQKRTIRYHVLGDCRHRQ